MAAPMRTKSLKLCELCGRCIPSATFIQRRLIQESKLKSQWKGVIGLEIHAQIKTKSKLFSGSSAQYGGGTNAQVALLDAALPGTLPVLNKQCVEAGILTALALRCKINKISKFDRKHYFYADLPAGYQITQQRQPLAVGGYVNYMKFIPGKDKEPIPKSAELVQIQLEQDSGKSLHDEENKQSLIDLNRAGVGLMEIVTKPNFTNGIEAAAFVRELQYILKSIGTCDGKLEEGSLRVDANISVHRHGEPYGVRTEVKNLNSLNSVTKSIEFEIKRQIKELESGREIENETRSFDTVLGQTVPMRDKEKKQDYRFMPEPNLPPLHLFDNETLPQNANQSDVINIDSLKSELPELPEVTRHRLVQENGISMAEALVILGEDGLLSFYEDLMQHINKDMYIQATDFITGSVVGVLRTLDMTFNEIPVSLKSLAELCRYFAEEKISSSSAIKLLEIMLSTKNENVLELIKEHDMEQINDEEILKEVCEQIINTNLKRVVKLKEGKKKELTALTKSALKLTNEKGNGRIISQILKDLILNK